MLDTVKLESPKLEASVVAEIERRCIRRQGVLLETGESIYELTTGTLSGSWDSRVSLRVMRDEWRDVGGRVQLVSCNPYVVLEGSVHKAMLGHNIAGGPEDLQRACAWLCGDVGGRLGVELPKASEWLLRRADWAECYELPDFEAVEEYVWGLNSAEYPRRSVARYGRESIFAGGRTTAVKAYHKGPEFHKHDRPRLKSILEDRRMADLQHYANKVLRWEISVKAKKLDTDHDGKPRVEQVSDDYLRSLHYREVRRLVREGEADVKTVRKQKDVRDRLYSRHRPPLAGVLLGTWHQLSTLGEHETRKHMKRRTFYLHKKQLREAGVSWIGSDVVLVPTRSSLPADFSPVEASPYRIVAEDPAVTAKLNAA
jgi:II/X family phage/plasmid replication protein